MGAHRANFGGGVALAAALLAVSAGAIAAPACQLTSPPDHGSASHLHRWYGFLRSPTRLALDANDNVYVADALNGRVVVRAPDGRIIEDLRGFDYPVSVAVDSAGRLYVGEGRHGRVDMYDGTRERVGVLGQGDGEFGLPAFMAVHEEATGTRVFVSDAYADEVLGYDVPGGTRVAVIGGTGTGQFIFPTGLAVAAGELYVVDRGGAGLQVFGLDGTLRRVVTLPSDRCGFINPCNEGPRSGRVRDAGIHVTGEGIVYLAESTKGRVTAMAIDEPTPGEFRAVPLGSVGDFGTAPGRLRVATDVVLDSCGRVLVTSAANGRVDLFGLSGHSDPEAFAPARLHVITEPLDPTTDAVLLARLDIAGHRLESVEDIVANGLAMPLEASVGDSNGDTRPDLALTFGADLVQTLGGIAQPILSVTGTVGTLAFQASAPVTLVVTDADGDGVDDPQDGCPDSAPDAVVDAHGCSLEQACPCNPAPAWVNHGQYVACVAAATGRLIEVGVLSVGVHGGIMREAARSRCGTSSPASGGSGT